MATHTFERHLAELVRGRRRSLRLGQVELSDLAGCSSRFIYEIEHGKPSLRLDKVRDVLEILGVDIALSIRDGQP